MTVTNLNVLFKTSRFQSFDQFKVGGVSYLNANYYQSNNKATEVMNHAIWNLAIGSGGVVAGYYGNLGAFQNAYQSPVDSSLLYCLVNGPGSGGNAGAIIRVNAISKTATLLTTTTQGATQVHEYSDGWIVAGTTASPGPCYLYWYDTSIWHNVQVDPSGGYGYTQMSEPFLSNDRAFAYFSVGTGGNSSYIVAVRLSDNTQSYFEKANITLYKQVYEAADHSHHYYELDAGPTTFWQLNGLSVPTSVGGLPAILNHEAWRTTDYIINTNGLFPTISGKVQPVITAGPGIPVCDQLTVALTNAAVSVIYADPRPGAVGIMGGGSDYGPVFTLNPATDAVSQIGFFDGNIYDLLWCANTQRYIVTGYDNFLGEYDPTVPWSSTNPLKREHPGTGSGEDHYNYIQSPKDKKYYFGVNGIGKLCWADPSNWAGWQATDLINFGADYNVIDVKSIRGGSYIAVSLTHTTDSKIGMVHVLDQKVKKYLKPGSTPDFGMMVEALRPGIDTAQQAHDNVGHIVGLTYNASGGAKAYRLNTYLSTVEWSVDLPNNGNYNNNKLQMGPDGYIYYLWCIYGSSSGINKISPVDGTITAVISGDATFNYGGRISWVGNNLYMFANALNQNVYKITGLF